MFPARDPVEYRAGVVADRTNHGVNQEFRVMVLNYPAGKIFFGCIGCSVCAMTGIVELNSSIKISRYMLVAGGSGLFCILPKIVDDG